MTGLSAVGAIALLGETKLGSGARPSDRGPGAIGMRQIR
ncbi:MAG: hypothetical protein QOG77_787 [Solirubrobacteraceae bacterium]|jgi:hypothetical protein|nr:hypothetical protein [Solirubrobacteraceae bacterium]